MAKSPYYAPEGGLSPQSELLTGRAVLKSYSHSKGVMQDIVTSRLPFWEGTRAWVLARPLTGFAETFSQCIVEVESGGGAITQRRIAMLKQHSSLLKVDCYRDCRQEAPTPSRWLRLHSSRPTLQG